MLIIAWNQCELTLKLLFDTSKVPSVFCKTLVSVKFPPSRKSLQNWANKQLLIKLWANYGGHDMIVPLRSILCWLQIVCDYSYEWEQNMELRVVKEKDLGHLML